MGSRSKHLIFPSGYQAPSSLCLSALKRLSLGTHNTCFASAPIQLRYASHASQGRANKAAQGPGKRLGAKKSDSEPVVPGNIIFRQRGTLWFPGENCDMGRDHTIFATAKGFVRFYRDPERHKERKYIGVVFRQEESLPRGRNAARRRRVGMEAVESPIQDTLDVHTFVESTAEHNVDQPLRASALAMTPAEGSISTLRAGYQYRESNTSIGRAAEKAKVRVRAYNPKDRFLAWRKAQARKTKSAERRSLRRK